LSITYPEGTSTTFTYDATGNVLTAGNAVASYTFTYDSAGRALSVADGSGRTIKYNYDPLGRKLKTSYPEGSVVSYAYDAAGRLSSMVNGEGRAYDYRYDTAGRRSSLKFPNGTKATYNYDPAGRLTEVTHKTSSGATIASFRYGLDKVGNRLSKVMPNGTVSYQYDPVYRLTEALYSTPGYSGNSTGNGGGIANATQQQKEFYSYDPVGNRLTSHRNKVHEYNEGNQLVSDGGTYAYDKNGNLIQKTTSDGTTAYVWDYENRLVKVTGPDGTITEFSYDPFGRRISKKVTQGTEAVTTQYFYDDKNLILEYDGAGGTVTNKYVHGPGIDEPVAVMNGKGTYFYHLDGLGSVVALTDQRGTTVETYEYDSFGNLKDQKNRIKQAFSYTGREWEETGLHYYINRYYDPIDGRFLGKDPIGIGGGINLYGYVGNNPVNRTDPFGLFSVEGFPSESQAQVINAINEVLKKLADNPCCAGGDKQAKRYADLLNRATIVYKSDLMRCAYTPLKSLVFSNEIQLGSKAFSFSACCHLGSTIFHEVTHLDWSTEGTGRKAEADCFGCK
jgi:RHS repeat-associated protein